MVLESGLNEVITPALEGVSVQLYDDAPGTESTVYVSQMLAQVNKLPWIESGASSVPSQEIFFRVP